MTSSLSVSAGQYSDAGVKPVNQDFHGLLVPKGHQLITKGIAVAIADGISSSNVSQIASESAVAGFLSDYFSTPESWSVKQSAQRVLLATNAWLHAQTRQSQYRYDRDRGYVCTLSVMVLRSATAHLFHIGDTRIYRVHHDQLEQLSTDHRLWLSPEESCLTRAMGIGHQLDIDYRSLPIQPGDTFLLATDGIHEHLDERTMAGIIRESGDDLDAAARRLAAQALEQGSDDNLTAQIIRVNSVPAVPESSELFHQLAQLPFAPELQPGQHLDGYRILRQIHASSRSHVYLAVDEETDTRVVLKMPSLEQRHDPVYLEQFSTEQWIARRISSAHVARPFQSSQRPSFLYQATEFVEGCTLRQWMLDHPQPDLDSEIGEQAVPRGAALYSAPETFLGEPGSWLSDQFSLGVITYQLLTGQLPYGAEVPKIHSRNQLRGLNYRPARHLRENLPAWVDDTIEKAVHPQAHRRYPALSEYLYKLRHPSVDWHKRHRPPLMERNPVAFWQGVSALLLLALLAALGLG